MGRPSSLIQVSSDISRHSSDALSDLTSLQISFHRLLCALRSEGRRAELTKSERNRNGRRTTDEKGGGARRMSWLSLRYSRDQRSSHLLFLGYFFNLYTYFKSIAGESR